MRTSTRRGWTCEQVLFGFLFWVLPIFSLLCSILNVNLKSAINASGVAARKMREAKIGGSIVNVSSNAALCGIETHCSYTASKAAMDGVTKVMAVEYGPHNVR